MDPIELMSPHVAIPVIGVLMCAVMVFAFGFRSSVQPPSFAFDDEQEKRSAKKKVKPAKQPKAKVCSLALIFCAP